jgi:hypothetical protein
MTNDPEEAHVDAIDATWQRFLDRLRQLPDGGCPPIPSPDKRYGERQT